jgi:hypothetical protein
MFEMRSRPILTASRHVEVMILFAAPIRVNSVPRRGVNPFIDQI